MAFCWIGVAKWNGHGVTRSHLVVAVTPLGVSNGTTAQMLDFVMTSNLEA
jgi:hypothetical protein